MKFIEYYKLGKQISETGLRGKYRYMIISFFKTKLEAQLSLSDSTFKTGSGASQYKSK